MTINISIKSKWWTDDRYDHLADLMGPTLVSSRKAAFAEFFFAVKLAERYWTDGKKLIPIEIWKRFEFHDGLFQSGLAILKGNEVYVTGIEDGFEWWHVASESGKKSAAQRKINKLNLSPLEDPCKGVQRCSPNLPTIPISIPILNNIHSRDEPRPYEKIIDYLNQKTNSKYKANSKSTIKFINARLNEKFTVEDFKTVVDIKSDQWLNSDMEKYLRPETLFGNKFESYLNEKNTKKMTVLEWQAELWAEEKNESLTNEN